MKPCIRSITLVLASLCSASPVEAEIRYVDDSAAGANNGTSWENAYTNLENGLAAAQAGDEVRIGQGTYRPAAPNGLREATFTLPNGVLAQGGYAGVGAADPDANDPEAFPTILSGDLNGNDGANFANYDENSYHVVTIGAGAGKDTQLRGVTVRAGNADLSDFPPAHSRGGGLTCLGDASPTIDDCRFLNNQALSVGGAMFSDTGAPAIDGCTFERNRVTSNGWGGAMAITHGAINDSTFLFNRAGVPVPAGAGGALYADGEVSITDSVLQHNSGGLGTAVSFTGETLSVSGCAFSNNGGDEGAIYAANGTHVNVRNSTFTANSGCCNGAALQIRSGAHVLLEDCTLTQNGGFVAGAIYNQGTLEAVACTFAQNEPVGDAGGGALRNTGAAALVNCLFAANEAKSFGGAILNAAAGTLEAVNCQFAGNESRAGGAVSNSGTAEFVNSHFVGNRATSGAAGFFNMSGTLSLGNCILWDNNDELSPFPEQEQVTVVGGTVITNNSCVMGWSGSLGGYGNFGTDPQMIDGNGPDNIYGTSDDNPRLSPASPCRDEGNNAFLPADEFDLDGDGDTVEPTPVDLDELPRMVNGIVDIGAYEFQGPACVADVSPGKGDGTVDVNDLLTVVGQWGPCSSGCSGDIDNNGQVDVNDLLAVIGAWGACP